MQDPILWRRLSKAHLAAGRHALRRVTSGSGSVTMLNGQTFDASIGDNGVSLDGVQIGADSTEATNGLLFELDGVLMPDLSCPVGNECPVGLVCGATAICEAAPELGFGY